MNINGFRRWPKAQIALFDDDAPYTVDRGDETVPIIREAGKIAIELVLPNIARHCTYGHDKEHLPVGLIRSLLR